MLHGIHRVAFEIRQKIMHARLMLHPGDSTRTCEDKHVHIFLTAHASLPAGSCLATELINRHMRLLDYVCAARDRNRCRILKMNAHTHYGKQGSPQWKLSSFEPDTRSTRPICESINHPLSMLVSQPKTCKALDVEKPWTRR